MAQTLYKKINMTIPHDDGSVAVQCVRLKSEDKLAVGDEVTIRGELRNRNGVLEFGTGCTAVKAAADHPAVEKEVVEGLVNLPEGEAFANGFCALTGTVEVVEKLKSDLPQKATLFAGAITMFIAAVFYMFMADLTFKNIADNLIIAVLLSFGSAILFFLSANFAEKPKIMYLLKWLGMGLGAGFILYMHFFAQSDYFLGVLEKLEKQGIAGESDLIASHVTVIVTLVLSYLALVGQIVNTVLVAVIKED